MADEQETLTVAEDVSTSVSAEPVEATEATTETATEQPTTTEEVWDFENVEKEETTETVTEPEAKKTEEKQEEKSEEKSLEEKALEEAFADAEEKEPEPEKEEDLDKLDPKEMIERQRNATARAWAERNAKKAEIVKDFQFEDKPIEEIAAGLEKISEKRYAALSQHAAHKLVDSNPQGAFERAYAIKALQTNPSWDVANATYPKLEDLIANGVGTGETKTQTTTAAPPVDLKDLTAELDTVVSWNWRDPALDDNFVDERELAMAKAMRALESKAAQESQEKNELNEKLQGLTTTQQSSQQEEFKGELMELIYDFRDEVEKQTLPYILKSTGLEVSADDTPEIKAFKELRQLQFKGTDYERANKHATQFESFANNESSVRNEIEMVYLRIGEAKRDALLARKAGNKAEEDRYHRLAADEKLPLQQLMGQALKEYKARYLAPDMALLGLSSAKITEPIKEASERVEVVSNGSGNGTQKPRAKNYQSANDVWDDMVTDAEKEERLRANA